MPSQDSLLRLIEQNSKHIQATLLRLSGAEWIHEAPRLIQSPSPNDLEAGAGEGCGFWFSGPVAAWVFFPRESGQALAKAFMFKHVEGGDDFLDRRSEIMERLGRDTLAETANILAHSLADPLAEALGVKLTLSAPSACEGLEAQVLETLGKELGASGGYQTAVLIPLSCAALAARCWLAVFLRR
ncbi:MAG: hypothetical protein HY549_04080 [Elusimicrobia bacterium]|nr:hypothetical protein [Elusimicrobiota bacterium]